MTLWIYFLVFAETYFHSCLPFLLLLAFLILWVTDLLNLPFVIRPKKVVLFPEISLSLPHPHSRMCIRINIFNFKKAKPKQQEDKTQKKLKKKREYPRKISQGKIISFANLLCVLSNYLMEPWISPGCSYEFNEVYVQWEKSQYMRYILSRKKTKSLRDIFVHNFFFYICLFIAANLL